MASSEPKKYFCGGGNYGDLEVKESVLLLKSQSAQPMIELKLDAISQCVIPASRDEVEIQFHEGDMDREEDGLVQITFHFPSAGADADKAEKTAAESFHDTISKSGMIRSITGNIIADFSREQGNFVSPRGKYSIQMTATYFHMQGPQYGYKIKYEDITSLFLLPKIDGGRKSFVISLDKPIRQGNQKYQHLVMETHSINNTLNVNLSESDCKDVYDGQLSPVMTMPQCNLVAKVFKVLSGKTVFVPKQFVTSKGDSAVRCSLKANEGLLYPLAKSMLFLHKPTIYIKLEDVECVEFKRFGGMANTANRSFDLQVTVKAASVGAGDSKDFIFASIDRSEYGVLNDFFTSKKLTIKNPQESAQVSSAALRNSLLDDDEAGGHGSGSNDSEEDDEDYKGGESSDDNDQKGSDGSDDESEEGEAEEKAPKKRKDKDRDREHAKPDKSVKKAKSDKEHPPKTKSSKPDKDKEKQSGGVEKKKRPKKDKNAPKGASSSYIMYTSAVRGQIRAEHPEWSLTDISKEMGVRWKQLTAEDKTPYEQLAKVDKERYQEAMKLYKSAAPAQAAKEEEETEETEEIID